MMKEKKLVMVFVLLFAAAGAASSWPQPKKRGLLIRGRRSLFKR